MNEIDRYNTEFIITNFGEHAIHDFVELTEGYNITSKIEKTINVRSYGVPSGDIGIIKNILYYHSALNYDDTYMTLNIQWLRYKKFVYKIKQIIIKQLKY